MALSLPPWGWWPLGWVGLGVLAWLVDGLPWRQRALVGLAFGLGQFVPGLWWMLEFNAVGAVLVMLLETAMVVGACVAARSLVALPAALVLAEFVRGEVPFGGLPMAGVALGQVDGPLAGAARLGGALLVLGLAALAGAFGAAVARRRPGRQAAALAFVVVAVSVLAWAAPDGGPSRRALSVDIVQGGGPRGFRGVETDPRDVFDRALAASERVRPGVELVLWPEDVIDVNVPIREAEEGAEMRDLAVGLGAPVVAGVVEDAGPDFFRNAAVLWEPDGRLAGRYDKVHRVPFGEYVPGRSLVSKVVDLSVIPRDAVSGSGPGILRPRATPPLGVVISFEVYFSDRARAAVEAGGQVLLVPTNAASFRTSQVPTTEVASAQLRAIETGRDVAQAAPTGYGAVIDHHGRVRVRTVLGRAEVLHGVLHARTWRTVYSRTGDGPVLAVVLAVLGWFWLGPRLRTWRSRRRSRTSPSP